MRHDSKRCPTCGRDPMQGAAVQCCAQHPRPVYCSDACADAGPLECDRIRAKQDAWHKRRRDRARASLVYRYRSAY